MLNIVTPSIVDLPQVKQLCSVLYDKVAERSHISDTETRF